MRCHVTTLANRSAQASGRVSAPCRDVSDLASIRCISASDRPESFQIQQITYKLIQYSACFHRLWLEERKIAIRPYLHDRSRRFCVKQHEEYSATHCQTRISPNTEFLGIVSRSGPFELLSGLQHPSSSQIGASNACLVCRSSRVHWS